MSSSPTEAERTAHAIATVADTLSWMGAKYQPGDTTAVIDGCSSPSDTARCITVTIIYPYAARPLLPQAPGLGLVTPNQIKASAVLRIS